MLTKASFDAIGRWKRLALISVIAYILIALLIVGLFELRTVLASYGYLVSDRVFIVFFFAIAGGGYGLAAQIILAEVRKLPEQRGAKNS